MTVRTAERLARAAHAGLTENYTGDPYDRHLMRVVALVGDASEETKAVAWLHDTLEDTALTAADLRAHGFSDTVVRAVELLTHKGHGHDAYAVYIDAVVASGSTEAIAVKRADILDHLRPSPYLPDRKRRKYEDALKRLTTTL